MGFAHKKGFNVIPCKNRDTKRIHKCGLHKWKAVCMEHRKVEIQEELKAVCMKRRKAEIQEESKAGLHGA